MATKSSHPARRSRRKANGARPRNRSSSRPAAPAAPKPQISPAQDGAEVRPSAQLESLAKREVEVRRIPLARPFHACPRCDNNHESLEVKRLTRPSEGFSHFATCPNLGEPILIAMGGA